MVSGPMPNARTIVCLHDQATEDWHLADPAADLSGDPPTFAALILAQHRANFDLWHREDEARDPTATDARITHVKHAIDTINQRRNDLVETIDGLLNQATPQSPASPLHSETPGMIIDRMSIMALKIFHTREETERATATEQHRQKNGARLAILTEQRNDLAGCFDVLLQQVQNGERRFKIYKQMKMYNDPELNPFLYRRGRGLTGC